MKFQVLFLWGYTNFSGFAFFLSFALVQGFPCTLQDPHTWQQKLHTGRMFYNYI